MADETWREITKRNARSVQTTVGWIFWDPGALERLQALGLLAPLAYIAGRAAPLGGAGPSAVIAAFGSISPIGIRWTFEQVAKTTSFEAVWQARDEAIAAGLREHAPDIVEPLIRFGPKLWPIVESLPSLGRVFFAAHLDLARPADPLLSGWHAVNCLREWRGDTHWALVTAAGLTGVEASIVHNAWLGYEPGWLARSRGSTDEDIASALVTLEAKGLARDGEATPAAVALRHGSRTTRTASPHDRGSCSAKPTRLRSPRSSSLRAASSSPGST